MFPPSQGLSLDITAISGILGAISIACWVVVFSPQILENFQRKSADALSVAFIVIWLAGDIFNILGGVLQGVLPTMNILAVYYTFADLVLLGQLFYYRGFTFKDTVPFNKSSTTDLEDGEPDERTGLLANGEGFNSRTEDFANLNDAGTAARTRSRSTFRERLTSFAEVLVEDGDHLSPATPLRPATKTINDAPNTVDVKRPRSLLRATIFNASIIILVCAFGASVWLIINRLNGSQGGGETEEEQQNTLKFNRLGQVFGYFCAALYLGSRLPQLHLNYRRKSTEGIAPLFFLFACIGNITYVLSIFAFEPICRYSRCEPGEAKATYGRYMLVNLSWLIGSAGCLLLDGLVFVQFWMYRKDEDEVAVREADGAAEGRGNETLLQSTQYHIRTQTPNTHFELSGLHCPVTFSHAYASILTEDETDDLLYLTRTDETAELVQYIDALALKRGCEKRHVLEGCVDLESGNSCLHFAAANGFDGERAPSIEMKYVRRKELLRTLLALLVPQSPARNPADTALTPSTVPPASPLVNHPNASGNTPLHWASLNGHLSCAKQLVAAGADVWAKNAQGHTAMFEADTGERWDVVGWLASVGGGEEEEGSRDGEGEEDAGMVDGGEKNGDGDGDGVGDVRTKMGNARIED
ncbi:hypothetical protein B0A49_05604 [Cryomyces minteri]|uniref:Uncharacterized protein n=1 Tax=Cryomyces minteri TaxID=331657 RepID=A0A4U0X6G1_9PEZI|nr:hypothetical protein B0A49_05604 [Cryomyces minteri]